MASITCARLTCEMAQEVPLSTIADRANTAVIVVDMQNDVVANACNRERVIANINALIRRARDGGITVIWVQHSSDELAPNSNGWALVPELVPLDQEPVVHKRFGDSFEDTTLESELASRGVGRLIVTGAQTDACIRSTIHGAFTRGYDTTLVSDAHTTDDYSSYGLPPADKVIAHTNMYWQWQRAPGRTASVEATDAVNLGD
jgi:nicotinamidase-related amidase